MEINTYAIEKIANGRLTELRAAGARVALIESARIGSRGVGVAVGSALIRIGHWLAPAAEASPPNAGVRVGR